MDLDIFSISLGFDQCYIIRGESAVMVDGGQPKRINTFLKGLKKASIPPESIKLLILTHGHWDHIGSAAEIKQVTQADVALHKADKDCLEKSLKPLPPGVTPWGTIFINLVAMFMPLVRIPAADVDIVLDDEDYPLDKYGIPGRIVSTPGHSPGSVSVLLDTGEVFVGDMAMNALPLRLTPGLPILAEDTDQVRESWQLLLDKGAKTIYPAHGSPFSAEIIRRAIENGSSRAFNRPNCSSIR